MLRALYRASQLDAGKIRTDISEYSNMVGTFASLRFKYQALFEMLDKLTLEPTREDAYTEENFLTPDANSAMATPDRRPSPRSASPTELMEDPDTPKDVEPSKYMLAVLRDFARLKDAPLEYGRFEKEFPELSQALQSKLNQVEEYTPFEFGVSPRRLEYP